MTVTLELNQEIEQGLLAQARASVEFLSTPTFRKLWPNRFARPVRRGPPPKVPSCPSVISGRSAPCTGATSTTMSVEPGVVDANILVYAINPDAPRHASSHALLEEARDPSARLYVTPQILCEFYSIITNPRRVAVPTPPADAVVIISGLLAQPGLYVLPAGGTDPQRPHNEDEMYYVVRGRLACDWDQRTKS